MDTRSPRSLSAIPSHLPLHISIFPALSRRCLLATTLELRKTGATALNFFLSGRVTPHIFLHLVVRSRRSLTFARRMDSQGCFLISPTVAAAVSYVAIWVGCVSFISPALIELFDTT
jgi:hypothetical protein